MTTNIQTEVLEKHIFNTTKFTFQSVENSSLEVTSSPTVVCESEKISNQSTQQPQQQTKKVIKTSLSKLVEYPGDPIQLREYLEGTTTSGEINPGGKDMLGYTALHKFASWNKLQLVQILLPYLSFDEIMCRAGGINDLNQFTVLHLCVEMKAWNVLEYLLSQEVVTKYQINLYIQDKKGRTYFNLINLYVFFLGFF